MPDMIRDGQGKGYLAAVDNENRLHTDAVTRSHLMHHSLDHQDAFNAYLRHEQQVNATDEIVGYITYTGNDFLIISKTVFSTNSAGQCQFEIFGNPTTLAGGATAVPTNFNFASSKTLSTTNMDTNDGASAITAVSNGTEFADLRIGWQTQPTFVYEFDDGVVLAKNDTFMILANAAAAGDKMRVNVLYYEEENRS